MKRNHRIGPDQFIYIDFEGVGRKTSGPKRERQQHPSLLGALIPDPSGGQAEYRVYLLEPELRPMEKAARLPGVRRVATLEETLRELLALASDSGRTLVYFSCHELHIVERFTPSLLDEFRARSHNIKEDTDPLVRKRLGKKVKYTLSTTVRVLRPNQAMVKAPGRGPAAVCRQLRKAGQSRKKWKAWTQLQKQRADQLLRYNRDDCEQIAHLMRVVIRSKRTAGRRSGRADAA